MTKKDLQHWAETASWQMVSEYAVAWIAAESDHGWELGLKWIDAKKENVQSSGWATLANLVALKNDEDIDIKQLKNLLHRVEKEIASSGNCVRYTMNGFVIAIGSYVKELTTDAMKIAKSLGPLTIDMNGTSCKVSYAPDHIEKTIARSNYKKKKMTRC